jgi:hypothetical protein
VLTIKILHITDRFVIFGWYLDTTKHLLRESWMVTIIKKFIVDFLIKKHKKINKFVGIIPLVRPLVVYFILTMELTCR